MFHKWQQLLHHFFNFITSLLHQRYKSLNLLIVKIIYDSPGTYLCYCSYIKVN